MLSHNFAWLIFYNDNVVGKAHAVLYYRSSWRQPFLFVKKIEAVNALLHASAHLFSAVVEVSTPEPDLAISSLNMRFKVTSFNANDFGTCRFSNAIGYLNLHWTWLLLSASIRVTINLSIHSSSKPIKTTRFIQDNTVMCPHT